MFKLFKNYKENKRLRKIIYDAIDYVAWEPRFNLVELLDILKQVDKENNYVKD